MKKNKIKITGIIENHDHINHVELRSDIENNNIKGRELEIEGKVNCSPETWSICVNDSDDIYMQSYQYDSKVEYDQDVKLIFGE